jgi:hypothetical protein
MFATVFTAITKGKRKWEDLDAAELDYVHFFTTDDIFGYVINASGIDRRMAGVLLRFDPAFFIRKCSELKQFRTTQLANICYYAPSMPSTKSDFFNAIVSIMRVTANNKQQFFVARRIMTVYLSTHEQSAKGIANNLKRVISKEIGADGLLPPPALSNLPAADIVEIVFAIMTSKKYVDLKPIMSQLAPLLPATNAYSLRLFYSDPCLAQFRPAALPVASIDPAIQIIAFEELTKQMQSDLDWVPSNDQFASFCSGRFAYLEPCLAAVYALLLLLTSRKLLPKQIKQVFDASMTKLFPDGGNAPRLAVILKRLLPCLELRGKEVKAIQMFCVQTAKSQGLPPAVLDLFTSVCDKLRENPLFVETVQSCLETVAGYNQATLAESCATQGFSFVSDTSDVIAVVPKCSLFFSMFNAVVVSEKKHRQMGHARFAAGFQGVHKRALELLSVPKFRIFAPMLALFPEDIPVPEAIETFFVEHEDKIQRLHVQDQYHEW